VVVVAATMWERGSRTAINIHSYVVRNPYLSQSSIKHPVENVFRREILLPSSRQKTKMRGETRYGKPRPPRQQACAMRHRMPRGQDATDKELRISADLLL
jgi:hypothetical protein